MAARRPIYSTYEELVYELSSLQDPEETRTIDVPHALRLLAAVSRRVDSILGGKEFPWFGPWNGTLELPLEQADISTLYGWWRLRGAPLFELTEVRKPGDPGEAIDDVTLQGRYLYLPTTNSWANVYRQTCDLGSARPIKLSVEGLWGWTYQDPFDEVDILTGTMVDNEFTSELPVDNPEAQEPLTGGLVYELGTVIQIGDEFMSVYEREPDEGMVDGFVRVGRGLFGSTRAEHEIGEIIRVWRYPESVSHEVARQASMLYARRGAFQAEMVDNVGLITYPSDLLESLRATLQDFQN